MTTMRMIAAALTRWEQGALSFDNLVGAQPAAPHSH